MPISARCPAEQDAVQPCVAECRGAARLRHWRRVDVLNRPLRNTPRSPVQKPCHPERSEGSTAVHPTRSFGAKLLRMTQKFKFRFIGLCAAESSKRDSVDFLLFKFFKIRRFILAQSKKVCYTDLATQIHIYNTFEGVFLSFGKNACSISASSNV